MFHWVCLRQVCLRHTQWNTTGETGWVGRRPTRTPYRWVGCFWHPLHRVWEVSTGGHITCGCWYWRNHVIKRSDIPCRSFDLTIIIHYLFFIVPFLSTQHAELPQHSTFIKICPTYLVNNFSVLYKDNHITIVFQCVRHTNTDIENWMSSCGLCNFRVKPKLRCIC